jgi:hypothetical protein
MMNATSVRSTGSLITGDVTYKTTGVTNANINSGAEVSQVSGLNIGLSANPGTSSAYGWSMIANPYLCPVTWNDGSAINSNASFTGGIYNNVGTNNVSSTYYYLTPTEGATGHYISCAGSICSNNTLAQIQSGQSIFLRSTTSSPQVLFKETNKVTTSRQKVFGTSSINKMYVTLNRKIDATLGYQQVDGSVVVFNKNYKNTIGAEDGDKLMGASDNIYFAEGTTKLGVNGRSLPTTTDMLTIGMEKLATADYQLQIDGSSYQANGMTPYLVDIYKRTSTVLTTGINTVAFTVDTTVKATYQNRFSITFKSTTLPINSITATATQANSTVKVSWTVVGATATTNYTVERSTDGTVFTAIGKTQATDYTDIAATEGTVYYRIKASDVDGGVAYSNTAKLSISNSQLSIVNVYPNPMTGKTLNVSLVNTSKGKYTITLTNILGQQVYQKAIIHNGVNAVHSIATGQLAKGTYQLTIVDAESKQQIHEASIEVQ